MSNRTGTYVGDSPDFNIGNQVVRFSLGIVEYYLSGKIPILTDAQSPVIFKEGTFPVGWSTGTLTFTNCNGSTSTKTQQNGGTWQQTDTGNTTTRPIPYDYC